MKRFRDMLGYVHEVPDDQLEEFERRRRPMLIAKIVIQIVLLIILLVCIFKQSLG